MIGRDTFQQFDHTLRSHATSHADRDFDRTVSIRKGPVCHLTGDERPVWHDDFGTVRRVNNACPDIDASDLSDVRIYLG